MELLFVVLIGAAIGAAMRYIFRGRQAYGALVLPAIGASVAAIVWAALTWVGWKFDGGWIWVATFVVAGVLSILFAIFVPRQRIASDERMLQNLSRA